jgi:hypothetical protein
MISAFLKLEVVYAGKGRRTIFWDEITSKYWCGGYCIKHGQPLTCGRGRYLTASKLDQGPAFIWLSRGETAWHLSEAEIRVIGAFRSSHRPLGFLQELGIRKKTAQNEKKGSRTGLAGFCHKRSWG